MQHNAPETVVAESNAKWASAEVLQMGVAAIHPLAATLMPWEITLEIVDIQGSGRAS